MKISSQLSQEGWDETVRRELRANMAGMEWDEKVRRELRANMAGMEWDGKEVKVKMGGMGCKRGESKYGWDG